MSVEDGAREVPIAAREMMHDANDFHFLLSQQSTHQNGVHVSGFPPRTATPCYLLLLGAWSGEMEGEIK